MGLEKTWIQDFKATLATHSISFSAHSDAAIRLKDQQIVRLFSLDSIPSFEHAAEQKANLEANGYTVYNLWEDVWRTKGKQVLSRLLYFSNLTERIHGRKCIVQPISASIFKEFLNLNHLQGVIACKFKYGLYYCGQLVAVAGFNQIRMPSKGVNYTSSELLRYCTLSGINISGGLSKLLKAHFRIDGFDDVMTYADKDWSNGGGYKSLKFNLISETPKVTFYVNLETYERYSGSKFRNIRPNLSIMGVANFVEVYNSGNLKFIFERDQYK